MDKNYSSINFESSDPVESLISGMYCFMDGSFGSDFLTKDLEKEIDEKLEKRKALYELITSENIKKIIDRYKVDGYTIKTNGKKISLDMLLASFILHLITLFKTEVQLVNEFNFSVDPNPGSVVFDNNKLSFGLRLYLGTKPFDSENFSIYEYNALSTGLVRFLKAQNDLVKQDKKYKKFWDDVYKILFNWHDTFEPKSGKKLRHGREHIEDLLSDLKFYSGYLNLDSYPQMIVIKRYRNRNKIFVLTKDSSYFLDQLASKIICQYYNYKQELQDSGSVFDYLASVLKINLSIDVCRNLAFYGLTEGEIKSKRITPEHLKNKYITVYNDWPEKLKNYIISILDNRFSSFVFNDVRNKICETFESDYYRLRNSGIGISPYVFDNIAYSFGEAHLDQVLSVIGQVLFEMDYKNRLVSLLLNEPNLFEKDCSFIKILGPLVCLNRIDNENVANYLRSLFEKGIDDDKNTIKRMVYIINCIKLPDEKQKHVIEKLKEYGYDENKYQKLLLNVKSSDVHVPKQSDKRGKGQDGNVK